MTADDLVARELMLNQFRRLIRELLGSPLRRTVFQRWEIEIVFDVENCALDPKRRVEILHKYERAVERQLETESGPPMKLSEYLQRSRTRRPSKE